MEVLSYQCPNCGAPLEFNSETQHWDCKFCLSSFGEEQLEEYNRQHSQEEEQTQEDSGEKKCYFCPNCGAELVTDDVTVATFCTFCGNPSVLPKKMEGEFHPKALIPFKLDKEQARQALYDLCKKKPLLPKDFTSHSHIEKVTGIYVPFWMHDSYVNAQMKAIGKRIHVWRTKDVEYTKTDVYDIVREAAMTYRNIPTDASKQMNDDMMDALEPFSYDDLKDFNMAFLSGYFAQRYDVTREECANRLKERITQSATEKLRDSCSGYTTVDISSMEADIIKSSSRYVMLPVWLLYTKYHGKDYLFGMNGQTGKMVGNLPLSVGKAAALAGIITAAVTILGTIGGLLIC